MTNLNHQENFENLFKRFERPPEQKIRRQASTLRANENEKSPLITNDSFHIPIRSDEKLRSMTRKRSSASHSRPVSWPVADQCDLRLFIIRHGERVDRFFGPNWFMLAFDQQGQYRPFHANLPPTLPNRSNKYFWAVDTPLTRDGLNAAQNVGRVLGLNRFEPTYAYSSPATRCIMTTYQILKGLGLENKIPIRIEPGLLEMGAARFGMDVFLTPQDWKNYGINVDSSYRAILSHIPPVENESAYYLRSKYVVRELEENHQNSSSSSSFNVLLVAHATSPETLTWDLVGRQPNVKDLYTLSLNIGYLQMVITERQRQNRSWALKQMPLQSTTLKWV